MPAWWRWWPLDGAAAAASLGGWRGPVERVGAGAMNRWYGEGVGGGFDKAVGDTMEWVTGRG
jgi:hypothetical protein